MSLYLLGQLECNRCAEVVTVRVYLDKEGHPTMRRFDHPKGWSDGRQENGVVFHLCPGCLDGRAGARTSPSLNM